MSSYRIQETDEAINDVSEMAIHIYTQYSDEIAAEKLIDLYSTKIDALESFPQGFRGLTIEHRGYEIRFFPFSNYNVFFVIREEKKDVVILRVLHQLQDWSRILHFDNQYHINGRLF